ncbi:hypothetical protein GSH08_19900 [Burkholderia pseudomallei]|nr:hypothetical protein [Burkholderia pseudomallei]MBM5584065.1 hypothetical protein [Burkholderia pseudomallei]RPA02074.1 hypothetical protein EGT86_37550 [Burkholderia pseudomallei]
MRVCNTQADARAEAPRSRAFHPRPRHRLRRPRDRRADRTRRTRFGQAQSPEGSRRRHASRIHARRQQATNVSARIAWLAHAGNHRKR